MAYLTINELTKESVKTLIKEALTHCQNIVIHKNKNTMTYSNFAGKIQTPDLKFYRVEKTDLTNITNEICDYYNINN